jgi:transmembrane sensor
MNADTSKPAAPDEMERAAALWVMRRDRGLTAAEQDELSHWLAVDPRHGEALREHHWGWDELDRLAGLQTSLGAPPNPDLLAPGARSNPARLRRLLWFVPVGLAAAAGIVIALRLRGPAPVVAAGLAPVVLAAPLERRVLDDGSVVDLGHDTDIVVGYDTAERGLRLLRGEATFTVARDRTRPFVVRAGGLEVRAIGTIFHVRLETTEVEVVVSEGRVMIKQVIERSGRGDAGEAMELEAGHGVVVSRVAGGTGKVILLTAAQLAARRAGRGQADVLVFADATLAEVVAAFNRSNAVQLVIGDAELAQQRLGGRFSANDVHGFLRLLESTSGIKAERRGEKEIVLRRAK